MELNIQEIQKIIPQYLRESKHLLNIVQIIEAADFENTTD